MAWRVAAAITNILILSACDRDPAPPPVTEPSEPPPTVQTTTLSRAEIVAALSLAASAHAVGAPPGDAATIAGRTFSIRLPFGCFGAAEAGNARALEVAGDGLASWTWSADRTTQTLSLTPVDWTRSTLLLDAGATPNWDFVEGYWIARPWLEGDACPSRPPASPAVAPAADVAGGGAQDAAEDADAAETDAAQAGDASPTAVASPPPPFTAGLASIRAEDASRVGRRQGEPYSFTVRAAADAPLAAPADGYRVVLQGRISTFPDGHAVRCSSQNPNRRPVCVAAVVLDSVAFETAEGQRLSEWRPEG